VGRRANERMRDGFRRDEGEGNHPAEKVILGTDTERAGSIP
jgi:hypothetical protein